MNDEHRRQFLRTLGDVCEFAGWGACILSQEQSFPHGCRNAETNPCDRDEVVWGNLHSALQCAASDEGTSGPQTLWKALWTTSAKGDDTRDFSWLRRVPACVDFSKAEGLSFLFNPRK